MHHPHTFSQRRYTIRKYVNLYRIFFSRTTINNISIIWDFFCQNSIIIRFHSHYIKIILQKVIVLGSVSIGNFYSLVFPSNPTNVGEEQEVLRKHEPSTEEISGFTIRLLTVHCINDHCIIEPHEQNLDRVPRQQYPIDSDTDLSFSQPICPQTIFRDKTMISKTASEVNYLFDSMFIFSWCDINSWLLLLSCVYSQSRILVDGHSLLSNSTQWSSASERIYSNNAAICVHLRISLR